MDIQPDSYFSEGEGDNYFLDHRGEHEFGWKRRPCQDKRRQKETKSRSEL